MINVELVCTGAEIIGGLMASAGAKVIVSEAVKKLTPENLSMAKMACVKVAEIGAATTVGAACAYGVSQKIEKARKYTEKVVHIFTHEVDDEDVPVVEGETEEGPVEIKEEPEE